MGVEGKADDIYIYIHTWVLGKSICTYGERHHGMPMHMEGETEHRSCKGLSGEFPSLSISIYIYIDIYSPSPGQPVIRC